MTPNATVVVVARDRWAQAPAMLDCLLARTDPAVPFVVVDARAPKAVAVAFDRVARSDRVSIVRRNRFFASNEARNAGADGIRTEWVAFVENDCILSPGWLERLIEVAEQQDATSAYPAYLIGPDGARVHGLGADLTLSGAPGCQRLREHQHHLGQLWEEVGPTLVPVERIQAEPHALVLRRSFLEAMGGFDESILSWFDHVDVALHHRRLGARAWLVPDVTCIYDQRPPTSLTELAVFALRWGRPWLEASLQRLCSVWGLDPDPEGWASHEWYRQSIHAQMPTPWAVPNQVISRAARPIEWAIARRWAAQMATDATVDPRPAEPAGKER